MADGPVTDFRVNHWAYDYSCNLGPAHYHAAGLLRQAANLEGRWVSRRLLLRWREVWIAQRLQFHARHELPTPHLLSFGRGFLSIQQTTWTSEHLVSKLGISWWCAILNIDRCRRSDQATTSTGRMASIGPDIFSGRLQTDRHTPVDDHFYLPHRPTGVSPVPQSDPQKKPEWILRLEHQ